MSKMRWSLIAFVVAFSGMQSTAFAENMGDSFSAAENGDFNKAVGIWESMAKNGDAQAQFNLGLMYHGGLGIKRDEKEAVRWYQKAAEGGYTEAQVYLVVGYQEGWFGLPQDNNKAYYWRGHLNSEQ